MARPAGGAPFAFWVRILGVGYLQQGARPPTFIMRPEHGVCRTAGASGHRVL
jgi:hypothetical protein